MASENEMKIIFGADTSPLRAEVAKGADAIDDLANRINKTADKAVKGFDRLNDAVGDLPSAFDAVVKSSITLTRINTSIEQAAKAAEQGRKSFDLLGQTPLNNLPVLDAQLKTIKNTLATGLKANIDTSGISPLTFNEVSASAEQLVATLLETINATKGLSSAFNAGLAEGIIQTLREAGVSVQEFRQALVGLNTSGVNLTPLISILDQIEAETGTTTAAVKVLDSTLKQLSSGGPPPFPLPPISDITAYVDKIKEIKAILASGVEANIANIKLDASQFTTLEARVNAANGSIRTLGGSIKKVSADSVVEIDKLTDTVDDIPKAFNKAAGSSKTIDDIGKSLRALDGVGDKWLDPFRDAPKALRTQSIELKLLDKELKTVKATLASGFKPAIDNIKLTSNGFDSLGKNLGKLKTNTNGATAALTDVSRVVQDLPYGFVGIANNLNPMIDSFARLKRESGSTGGALKALAGSLVGAGGIGLAIGVVTAAISIYQNGISGFNRKTEEAKDNTRDLAENIKSVSDLLTEGTGSVAGQIAEVQALSKGIQDTNNSYEERKRLLESLKGVNEQYFGDLTLESSKLETLSSRVREYSSALVQAAITKKFSDQIADLAINLGAANNQTDQALKKFEEAQAILTKKFPDGAPEGATAGVIGGVHTTLEEYNKLKAAVVKTEAEFLKSNETSRKLALSHAELNSALEKSIVAQSKFKSLTSGGGRGGGSKEDAQLKALKTQLDGVQDQLQVINELRKEGVLPKFREDEARDLELKVLDLLNKIDQREVEIKVKPKLEIDPQLNELQISRVEAEANKRLAFTQMLAPLSLVIDTKGTTISKIQASSNEALKRAGLTEYEIPSISIGSLALPADVQISGGVDKIVQGAIDSMQAALDAKKLGIKIGIAADSVGVSSEQFQAVVNEFMLLGQSAAEAFNSATSQFLGKNIAQTIGTGVENAFASIGSGIAEIFSGGGFEAAAEGFLGVIGDTLEAVGRQVIIASTLVKALKESLAALFGQPEIPLAIGIALVALGGILKNIKLAKGPTKFAEGGIVRGPTLGMVGESGPEMIIPLSRANQFTGGGQMGGFVASTQIRGQDLLVVVERAMTSNGRRGGNF